LPNPDPEPFTAIDRELADHAVRPVICGCSGARLTPEEARYFEAAQPAGFILFARNCQTPDQLRALIDELVATTARTHVPILIDQEGGRVARLGPPHWRRYPPAAQFGALAERNPGSAERAVWAMARLIAAELADVGITVDCAPVVDLARPEGHQVIGDRAFSHDPDIVARLGRAFCDGLMAGGVLPVVKHIPGHGRAPADSHQSCPVVNTPRAELADSDFHPFRALADMPLAMTAHVVYADIDAGAPATLSEPVIADVIRGELGFAGVLISDDIGMGALEGPIEARARTALAAGCDLVLHCSGVLADMEALAATLAPMEELARARLARALAGRRSTQPVDPEELVKQMNEAGKGTPPNG